MGVKVNYFRYLCTIFGGIMAALGGASLLLGYIGTFNENIINGRGYIAISLVILGQWNPAGVLAAALVFGGVDALQWRLQVLGLGIPSYFLLMLPYILTITVLVLTARRSRAPASLGTPYSRQEK
jgi:simple sugar transport system permease protein